MLYEEKFDFNLNVGIVELESVYDFVRNLCATVNKNTSFALILQYPKLKNQVRISV